MRIPLIARVGGLVLVTTAFYTYVGQMVPQREVHPAEAVVLRVDMTTDELVTAGREIMNGKGLCLTCHTIGRTGALRFPDLAGIGIRAAERIPGTSDIEYLAESLYEPDTYVVEGFDPGMPPVHLPPVGLTDQEILAVIAHLQSLGGEPTVTLQTAHRFYSGAPTPDGAPAPAAPPAPDPAPDEATPPAPPKPGADRPPAVPQPHTVTR